MIRNPRVHRPGFTLIEMLITISIGSSVMLTAVALVHQALHLHSAAQTRIEQAYALDRFVEQFRRDIYLAASVELSQEQAMLVTLGNGEKVQYSAVDHELKRKISNAGKHHVELVLLSNKSSGKYSMEENSGCAALEIAEEQHFNSIRIVRRVEAAVGRLANRSVKMSESSSPAETSRNPL